ncbi:unnamed protein product [Hermetia illucens]|uniref:Uncharacterized protein n=1 Tax=Hermetia illucens TaxID=343691 RepID=A0A7R8V3V4_HERIL|nr:unnamed protein product [Hermetia illucens]
MRDFLVIREIRLPLIKVLEICKLRNIMRVFRCFDNCNRKCGIVWTMGGALLIFPKNEMANVSFLIIKLKFWPLERLSEEVADLELSNGSSGIASSTEQ